MKVEVIIVCKEYSDFLSETLHQNADQVDDIVVVTSHEDQKTQAVCAKYSVECVKTAAFTEGGSTLNKGQCINIGMDHCKRDGWLLHMDADMVLPRDFKRLLGKSHLDAKNIYGADRINVYGWDAWQALKPKLMPGYSSRWFIDPGFCHANPAPVGTRFGARIIHMEYGWVPIGFFQMWWGASPNRYNYKRGAAAGTDIMFPIQWPRENRILLPEIVCFHLDSELTHQIGTNWKGRKSRQFGPCERCRKCPCCCRPEPPPYCG